MSENTTARSALNYLACCPAGITTLSTSEADKALLETGGWMMACGYLYDLSVKPLTANVAQLSLVRREFS